MGVEIDGAMTSLRNTSLFLKTSFGSLRCREVVLEAGQGDVVPNHSDHRSIWSCSIVVFSGRHTSSVQALSTWLSQSARLLRTSILHFNQQTLMYEPQSLAPSFIQTSQLAPEPEALACDCRLNGFPCSPQETRTDPGLQARFCIGREGLDQAQISSVIGFFQAFGYRHMLDSFPYNMMPSAALEPHIEPASCSSCVVCCSSSSIDSDRRSNPRDTRPSRDHYRSAE